MLPAKVVAQLTKAGLPMDGECPFIPALVENKRGESMVLKQAVLYGPKKGKRGYVDTFGRIWIRDRAHGDLPDHWDVQEDGGRDYFRVNVHGKLISTGNPDDE
ncbi:MAG: polymorphic toxin type 17 domain-containing protein [Planctomycetaceae bacterium]|nr:polymorphic toxin type 17 domain-containing protein [Planctomycetaceae bacterium]